MIFLTFCDYYLPGFRAGGALRTIVNMVERLGEEFRFRIVTSDHDLRETSPHPGIRTDEWQPVGKAQVLYLSPRSRSFGALRRLFHDTAHDALYLNSLFSPTMTIRPLLLRRLGGLPRRPVLLAPRGETARDALSIKRARKRCWLATARTLGIYDGITWQASGEHEKSDILRVFPRAERVEVAPDLSAMPGPGMVAPHLKRAGSLDVVFLGRIARVKNLHGALEMLRGVDGEIRFDIHGPVDDEAYRQECARIASTLGASVRVGWHGALAAEEVPRVLASHHLLLLPSLGENFGHAILEALSAGCPVLISDRTPWRDLEGKGVGWDRPLDDLERFREVLRACVRMDDPSFRPWSDRAVQFGTRQAADGEVVERNRALLRSLGR